MKEKEREKEQRAKPSTEYKQNFFIFTFDFQNKCNWLVIYVFIHSSDIY